MLSGRYEISNISLRIRLGIRTFDNCSSIATWWASEITTKKSNTREDTKEVPPGE